MLVLLLSSTICVALSKVGKLFSRHGRANDNDDACGFIFLYKYTEHQKIIDTRSFYECQQRVLRPNRYLPEPSTMCDGAICCSQYGPSEPQNACQDLPY